MITTIIFPITVYNLQLQQWQKDELYLWADCVMSDKIGVNNITSITFEQWDEQWEG